MRGQAGFWDIDERYVRLSEAGDPLEKLFARFDKQLTKAGYLAMGGQIVDATIVAARKQRNTDAEKADIKAGKVPDAWKDKPAKLRQKDRDARFMGLFVRTIGMARARTRIGMANLAYNLTRYVVFVAPMPKSTKRIIRNQRKPRLRTPSVSHRGPSGNERR